MLLPGARISPVCDTKGAAACPGHGSVPPARARCPRVTSLHPSGTSPCPAGCAGAAQRGALGSVCCLPALCDARGGHRCCLGGDMGAARPQCHRTVPRSVSVSWGRGTRGWSRGAGQEEGREGCPLRPQRVPLRRALHMPVNFTPSALDGSLVIFGELSHKFVPPHCSNLLSGDGRAPLRSASRVPRGRGHPRAHRGQGYPEVHGFIPAQIPKKQQLAEL